MPGVLRCVHLLFWLVAGCSAFGQQFHSSNLPIMMIETHGLTIYDEPKIIVDMGVVYNGEGIRNNTSDPQNHFQGKIAIEIRGSSSQMFPKKQYGLELRAPDGTDRDFGLLGLPPESDWILFAPYNDKTLMRDVLAYQLGRGLGRYAPRARYCELVINGAYEGVYVLMEKIKRDRHRVNIDKLEPHDASGDELTGGYIIKIDKQTGDTHPGWFSEFPPSPRNGNQQINFLFEEPDAYRITDVQKSYIRKVIRDFEAALQAPDFADPLNGYSRFIDTQSFVDFFIMNELTKNVDGYRLSTYFHKQRNSDGGKLVMGPIWDFNLGFGNANYCTSGGPDGLVLSFNEICNGDWWLVPFWWNRLFEDMSFAKKVQLRWSELRAGHLSTIRIHQAIDSIANLLSESQVRNFERWPVLGEWVWPNYFVGDTYAGEVAWLKSWVELRTSWLDAYIGGFVTGVEENNPHGFALSGAYPNPTNADVQLHFSLDAPARLEVCLYDFLGRVVESHVDERSQAGPNILRVAQYLKAGTYFFRIRVNHKTGAFGKIVKH